MMAMVLQLTCDGQSCDITDEFSAGVLEGNVCVDLDPAAEGWMSVAGQDLCPRCAPKARGEADQVEPMEAQCVSEGTRA